MTDGLVRLGVTDELGARIWRDALAQEAIPVFIRPANAHTLTGIGPSIGDVLVFVRAADERRARWIIGDGVAPLIPDAGRAVYPEGSLGG
jgi:hypothetical protein